MRSFEKESNLRPFKVAAIQTCVGVKIKENIITLTAQIREAASQGAIYIQTPEMSNLLQPNRALFFEEIKPQDEEPMLKAMQLLAQELGVYLHLGSLAVKVEALKAANRGFLISPLGEILAHYDKIHLFDVTLPDGTVMHESAAYVRGGSMSIVETPFAKIGLTICYDMRFPQLYRQLAQNGAQLLTAPSSFTVPTGKAHWHTLLRARAIETGSFMIAAAQGGRHECGRETFGHSLIVNPWGEVIAESAHANPAIIYAAINLEEVTALRQKIPSLLDSTYN